MFAAKRRSEIVRIVNEKGTVARKDLCKMFDVTPMTINRDLKELSAQGKVVAARGGAISHRYYLHESLFSQRIDSFIDIKRRMATKALEHIKVGDTLFLDSSTTSLVLARTITKNGLTGVNIITNSLEIVNEMLGYSGIIVISTGGTVLGKSFCFAGPVSEKTLQQFKADTVFFSVANISVDGDLSDGELSEAAVKVAMMRQSSAKIALVGSYKFGRSSMCKVANVRDIDLLICDRHTDNADMLKSFEEQSIHMEIV